ncbi:MAG: hypothetical protein AB7N71_03070 [Phycisphaerae bacterium]
MKKNSRKSFGLAMTVLSAGTLFQLGGCSLGGVLGFLANTNPCGTVLACDPVAFRFLTSGADVPGVDIEVDPACTFPPFCANDPFVPAGDGG